MSKAGESESGKRAAAAECDGEPRIDEGLAALGALLPDSDEEDEPGIHERIAKLATLLPHSVEGTDDVLLMEGVIERIKDKKKELAELVQSTVASLPEGESSPFPSNIFVEGHDDIRTPEDLMVHLLRTKREETFRFLESRGVRMVRYKDSPKNE